MGKLNALKVDRLAKRGLHADGDGLYLQVGAHADAKSWIFRYRLNGKSRYLGLGSASAISLKRARELAAEPRRLVAEGIDPLDARRAQRATAAADAAKAVTFAQCAEAYARAREGSWRSIVHRAQWQNTLETYVYPVIGALPVQAVDTALVLKVLEPIWHSKPETASRVRGRIESILDAAKAREFRTGENPARWRGHLANLLPKPGDVRKSQHYAALGYRELPAFTQALRGRRGLGALALEFSILTAARRGEVLGAHWPEIDFEQRVWTIPGSRMKAGKEHKVPLSEPALAILRSLYAVRSSNTTFVFPGKPGRSLSNTAMLALLGLMGRGDLTAHGFRSTFKDWASEQTAFSNEVTEMALAHTVGSAVERAYRRGDLFDKRRRLMDEWGRYCAAAPATGEVVGIRG
jgi:integrase